MSVPTTPSGGTPYSCLADRPHELGAAAADDERREPMAAECIEQLQHRLVHACGRTAGPSVGCGCRQHELLRAPANASGETPANSSASASATRGNPSAAIAASSRRISAAYSSRSARVWSAATASRARAGRTPTVDTQASRTTACRRCRTRPPARRGRASADASRKATRASRVAPGRHDGRASPGAFQIMSAVSRVGRAAPSSVRGEHAG